MSARRPNLRRPHRLCGGLRHDAFVQRRDWGRLPNGQGGGEDSCISRRLGEDFRAYYLPTCKRISFDNALGKLTFSATRVTRRLRFARRAILRMTVHEQRNGIAPRMSTVLWDMFSGSASYREIFLRTLNPVFIGRLVWNLAVSLIGAKVETNGGDPAHDGKSSREGL